jgi:hypothetical protein
MSRLIDADKLLECVEASMLNNTHRNGNAALCHVSEHMHFIEMIVEQPTAFDVEKVIHELHNLRMDIYEKVKKGYPTETIEDYFNCGKMAGKNDAYREAIEIVKRG